MRKVFTMTLDEFEEFKSVMSKGTYKTELEFAKKIETKYKLVPGTSNLSIKDGLSFTGILLSELSSK